MKTAIILVAGFVVHCVQCFDSESFEYNGIEVSPLYETIIYSDIADILNEFDKNNAAYEKANNESESDEDVDDLLSEYHHYLEKAHKQRANYLEKNKLKNKVPIVRHDKFTKMKSIGSKHNDYYKNGFFKPEHKLPPVLNPFNMFIPFSSNKYMTSEQPPYNNELNAIKKAMLGEDSPMPSIPSMPVKLPCNCKDGRTTCKQCFMPLDHLQQRSNPNVMFSSDDTVLNNPMFPEPSDDTINVRIKVDVQLPKLQPERVQFYNPQNREKITDYDNGLSKEYLSAIKIPSPYFNFPIPMNLFGFKKMAGARTNKHDTQSSLHKITIHKKKKSKIGNISKKHRKKVITFHNIKIEPELSFAMFNMSANIKNMTENNNTVILNMHSNNTQNEDPFSTTSTTISPVDNFNISDSQTEENILLLVNITNKIENGTNENHKTENSIETDFTNAISNSTTEKPLHLLKKREISQENELTTPKEKTTTHKEVKTTTHKEDKSTTRKSSTHKDNSTMPKDKSANASVPPKFSTSSMKSTTKPQKKFPQKKANKKKTSSKLLAHKSAKINSTHIKLDKEKSHKANRTLPTDLELLYWPNTNSSKTKDTVKDFTTIILENENKKAKLNLTKDVMRHNHTRALEKAIFGDVQWNDVDAVAPAFISFVGKYIEGILTFCNERVCHSMKCTKKNCLHRFCAPKDRFKNGHCKGSNYTDSVASMESILDLPSNVAFEIVHILQDRMIGQLFGKITLCINSKCITFAASKKVFQKYKCINTEKVKELDAKGHCKQAKLA